MKCSKFISGVVLICCMAVLPVHTYGQVSKYKKLYSVGKNSFNYKSGLTAYPSQKSNGDLLIVYSDRDYNKAYADAYAQRVLSEQKIGTPYYVVDEKNDFYKVVTASQEIVGKPKGALSAFHGSKRHLKDSRNSPYVGWIPKDRILRFGHSFISTDNNNPIKFRVGTTSVSRLADMKPYCNGDTVFVFREPFFQEKNGENVLLGQILYAYKYDDSKQAVLVSDKPELNNKTRKVLGWIPSNLIAEVGQNHVYLLKDETKDMDIPLQSKLIFTLNGNGNNPASVSTHPVNLPAAVWDMDASKIMSIKGTSFSVSEIKKMVDGSDNLNIHLIFYDKDRKKVKPLISTLQSLKMKVPASFKAGFSITSISENGNKHLKCTDDYSQWLAFLEDVTSSSVNGIPTSGAGFHDAINMICEETPYVKFGNNLFIIMGTDEKPTFTPAMKDRLGERSSGILLVQLSGNENTDTQNFILEAKELLDANIAGYMNFITGYIVDPEWDKPSLFIDLGTEGENAYLLDTPKNSVAFGGLLFPKANGILSNTGFSNILDTLFVQIDVKNKELIASLSKYGVELGTQRAVPTNYVARQCVDASLFTSDLDRCSINEVLYMQTHVNDSSLSNAANGYLFAPEEMKSLLEGYRGLMPYFTSGIGKKQMKTLRNLYSNQEDKINNGFRRKVLNGKSTVSDLFYYKVGVPSSFALNQQQKIKDLRLKKVKANDWDECYLQMYERLINLENKFKSDKLSKINIAGTTYYFIPQAETL